MTSLWLDRAEPFSLSVDAEQSWNERGRYDTVVVGGGLTGLVTGLLLARSGQRVAVVEARTLGAVTTGNTTGKVSILQGTRLAEIARRHATHTLRSYVEGNLEGQQWLIRYCHERDIPVGIAPDFTYAQTSSGTESVQAQYAACRAAGLSARLVSDLDIPVPNAGAVTLDDQAYIDPMPVLQALARDILSHGGNVFERRRVTGARSVPKSHVLTTDHGDIRADRVVLATGIPILDRGGFFARLSPERSYAAAFDILGGAPDAMYLSADQPTRSLRPAVDGTKLLVGGNGHEVGRTDSAQGAVDDLIGWTTQHFPGTTLTHRWSAQDYSSLDKLPYVGPLVPGQEGILVATGFAKWGMTNAVSAALVLSARILGGHIRWADAFHSWSPHQVFDVTAAAKLNGSVAVHLASGWGGALLGRRTADDPAPSARVIREGLVPVGEHTKDGHTERVCVVCPHLGGVLKWNDAEETWDCPLHGSRFASDGKVLEGPSTHDLRRVT